jgi:hypothetical protein
MKILLTIVIGLFALSSCNIKNKIAKYTGSSGSLGIPQQNLSINEKPKEVVASKVVASKVVADEVVAKKVTSKSVVTEEVIVVEENSTDNVTNTQTMSSFDDVQILPDNKFNIVYVVGGLILVWGIVVILIKRKK